METIIFLLEVERTKRLYRLIASLMKAVEAEYPHVMYGHGGIIRFSKQQAIKMLTDSGDCIDIFSSEKYIGRVTAVQLK